MVGVVVWGGQGRGGRGSQGLVGRQMVGLRQHVVSLLGRRWGGGCGGGPMEEGVVVMVVGGVVVVGRLGGHVGNPLLGRHKRWAVAGGCRCAGSPRGNLRAFAKLLIACQQTVIGQAAVAGRVVRGGSLIGKALETNWGRGRLREVASACWRVRGARRSRRHFGQDGGVWKGGVRMPSKGVSGDASYSLSASFPPISSPWWSVLSVETRLGAKARLLTGLEEGGRGGGGISGASNALFST